MHIKSLLLLPTFLAAALASPAASKTTSTAKATSTCLTDAQATHLAKEFQSMLTNTDRQGTNKTGQAILAVGYKETSDSILSLEHKPLGTVTFAGKEFYLENVVNAPPIPAMNTLDIVHDCTKVVWYWNSTVGSGAYEVKGFNLMYTTYSKKLGHQILNNKVEFNSVAWGYDIYNTAINMTQPLK